MTVTGAPPRRRRGPLACLAVTSVLAAAPAALAAPSDVDSTRLEQLVTVQGITEHQKALNTIADLNGGTRDAVGAELYNAYTAG